MIEEGPFRGCVQCRELSARKQEMCKEIDALGPIPDASDPWGILRHRESTSRIAQKFGEPEVLLIFHLREAHDWPPDPPRPWLDRNDDGKLPDVT